MEVVIVDYCNEVFFFVVVEIDGVIWCDFYQWGVFGLVYDDDIVWIDFGEG